MASPRHRFAATVTLLWISVLSWLLWRILIFIYPDSMNIRKTACRWPKKGFWSGHDSPGLSEQSGTQRATRAGAGWPQRGADRAPRERGGVAQRRLELRGSGDGPAAGRRHGSQLA